MAELITLDEATNQPRYILVDTDIMINLYKNQLNSNYKDLIDNFRTIPDRIKYTTPFCLWEFYRYKRDKNSPYYIFPSEDINSRHTWIKVQQIKMLRKFPENWVISFESLIRNRKYSGSSADAFLVSVAKTGKFPIATRNLKHIGEAGIKIIKEFIPGKGISNG